MKKLSLAFFAIILVFVFVFAPLSGAVEIKSKTDNLTILAKKGDTIDGYIRKYFSDISTDKSAFWFKNAYWVFASLSKIKDPDLIKAGVTYNLSPRRFRSEMAEFAQALIKPAIARVVVQKPLGKKIVGNTKADCYKNNLFEVKVIKRVVIDKKNPTISHTAKYLNPPRKPTPGVCRAIADFNGIKDMNKVKFGQVILIPSVLIHQQTRVGVNPTTVGQVRTIEMVLEQTNLSLREAGIEAEVDKSKASSISRDISESENVRILNGKLTAAATFATGVQGWTKVTAKDELSGPSTSLRSGKYRINVTVAKQCNNGYSDIEKRRRILLPLPAIQPLPVFARPLPDGKVKIIKSEKPLRLVCLDCVEFNNVDGAFRDEPVTGGVTKGWWTSTEWWFDCHGNWTNGIGFLSQNWSGKSGDADPYHYSGGVLMPAIMTRYTDERWQFVARYASGKREDSGGFENDYVKYRSNGKSEIDDYYFSLEERDLSRKWFSKSRLALQFQRSDEDTQQISNRMLSKLDGSDIPLGDIEAEDQDTMAATLTSDIYSFDAVRNYLLVGQVGAGHQDNYDNNSFALKGGMQFFGGLKFLTGYTWNDSEPVADTKNIIDFEFYPYGLYKGFQRAKAYKQLTSVRKPDTPVEARARMDRYGRSVFKAQQKREKNLDYFKK